MKDIGFTPTESSPMLVATDGREQSDGAIRAGALLARGENSWRVITVAPPVPVFEPELDLRLAAEAAASQRDVQLQSAKEQVRRIVGQGKPVRVDVYDGYPADVIAGVAKQLGASLIVAGLGRHKIIDRILSDETALRLIRMAATPVLAVAQDFAIPRTVVAGFDFSENSIHAAQMALKFVNRGATVYLVNVAPREDVLSVVTGGRAAYEEHGLTTMRQLVERLEIPADVHVQPVVRHGDPATQILEYAAETGAGLIAVGTRGQGLVARMLVGSVATKIIRASTVAVLTLPD